MYYINMTRQSEIDIKTINDTYKLDTSTEETYYIKSNNNKFIIPRSGDIITNIEIYYYDDKTKEAILYKDDFRLIVGPNIFFQNNETSKSDPIINTLIPIKYLFFHAVSLYFKNVNTKNYDTIMIKVKYNNLKNEVSNNFNNHKIMFESPYFRGFVLGGLVDFNGIDYEMSADGFMKQRIDTN